MLLLNVVTGLPANVVAAAGQPAAADTVAVTNARIYPVTAPVIPSGILVVAGGKIAVDGRVVFHRTTGDAAGQPRD